MRLGQESESTQGVTPTHDPPGLSRVRPTHDPPGLSRVRPTRGPAGLSLPEGTLDVGDMGAETEVEKPRDY